jgi:hypothetical protein
MIDHHHDMSEHERGFVSAFVAARYRQRCERLMGKRRRRSDLLRALFGAELRSGRSQRIEWDELLSVLTNLNLLQRQCYVISLNSRIDQTVRRVRELLEVDGEFSDRDLIDSSILSIDPGRLAIAYYFLDEWFLLRRPE